MSGEERKFKMANTLEVMEKRCSCRNYKSEKVPKDIVDR